MTLDELEAMWAAVEVPAGAHAINGRRAPELPPARPIYLGVDGRRHRHLLILVPDETEPVNQRETRGLDVSTVRFEVGTNPEALYVNLTCLDESQNPTFSAITQDIIRALQNPACGLRDEIVNVLGRWRAFWSASATGMGREDALGLFGELWFMRRWLTPVNAEVISHWQATESARHDFQWPAVSIEAKTANSRSSSAPTHSISGLEQLDDPEEGQLYLFSLQVSDDALSANTLHSLVEVITGDLEGSFQALSDFNQKLAIRGYTPADQNAPSTSLRVLSERLYHVRDGFPRLTAESFEPGGVPGGVTGIEYALDTAACQEWLVAQNPSEAHFLPPSPANQSQDDVTD